MSKYAKHVANPRTSQSKKAKEGQVKNSAGGYVFEVDDWTRLNRFLILGCEGGSYYASESDMALTNYDVIKRCLASDSKRTVDTIVQISDEGRAIKNAPGVFALAVCSVFGDQQTRAYANKVMPKVARYSTDLFSWVDAVNILKNGRKGKGMLRAIGRWYTEKDASALAYQICKYPSRSINGHKWGHDDLLRLARISPAKSDGKPAKSGKALTVPSEEHDILLKYAVHGVTSEEEAQERAKVAEETGRAQEKAGITLAQLKELENTPLRYIYAHELCKKATTPKAVVSVINKYKVSRESVEPSLRNNIEVQRALLPTMPMTALIRNLGGMTASGLLKPLADETSLVIDKITNEENLKKARIHPMSILLAMKVYEQGHGLRTTWTPVSQIIGALEESFYAAFNYVESTGKKYLLGIDVSGSMNWNKLSEQVPMTSAECAAAVAMTIAKTEKNYQMMAFADSFKKLEVTNKDSLSTVLRKTNGLNFGGTDCSLPMLYAIKHSLDVDLFVVLTDSETWFGGVHPFQALKEYRRKLNKNAKLAVLAFEGNKFSIADPSDAGMLDIAGMDSNVPKILSDFAMDRI